MMAMMMPERHPHLSLFHLASVRAHSLVPPSMATPVRPAHLSPPPDPSGQCPVSGPRLSLALAKENKTRGSIVFQSQFTGCFPTINSLGSENLSVRVCFVCVEGEGFICSKRTWQCAQCVCENRRVIARQLTETKKQNKQKQKKRNEAVLCVVRRPGRGRCRPILRSRRNTNLRPEVRAGLWRKVDCAVRQGKPPEPFSSSRSVLFYCCRNFCAILVLFWCAGDIIHETGDRSLALHLSSDRRLAETKANK